MFIGIILAASQQLTGINAVIFYSPDMFKSAGFCNTAVLTILVVGTWNLLSVFVSFVLVDKLGRRVLMLAALVMMALGLGLLGTAYAAFAESDDCSPVNATVAAAMEYGLGANGAIGEDDKKSGSAKGVIAIAALMLFLLGFETGPGPLFFLMATETFPEDLREPALSFTNGANWSCNIALSFLFPIVVTAAGSAATFFIMFAFALVSIVLIFLFLPETKNKVIGHNINPNEEGRSLMRGA